jgi:hypothetical protein
MEPPGLDPETDLVSVPNLPNSFSLVNLLTKKECASLRAAAHAVGWRRDAGTATQSVDDRLDYCEILMWPELVEKVFSRIKSHLPPGACGVNARWRFFRYGPDTVRVAFPKSQDCLLPLFDCLLFTHTSQVDCLPTVYKLPTQDSRLTLFGYTH